MKYAKFFVPLLIICGVLYFLFEKKDAPVKRGVFTNLGDYFFVKVDDVDRVELFNGEEKIYLAKNNGSWMLESPIISPADESPVKSLVKGILQNAIHRELKPDEISDMSEYGLEEVKESITFYGKQKPLLKLQIGDTNPTGSDLYTRKEGGGEVILTAVQLKDILVYDTDHYRSKSPFRIDPANVKTIDFIYPDNHIRLERKGESSNWHVVEPQTLLGNNSKVERILGQLGSMKITLFLNTKLEGEESYGLDSPHTIVKINGDASYDQQSFTIELGDTDVESNSVYARLSNLPGEDVLVEASIEHKLQLTVDDLREDSLFLVDPSRIESLDVREQGSKNLSIYQTPRGNWKMLSPVKQDISEESLNAFLLKLADIRSTEYINKDDLVNIEEDKLSFVSYTAKIEVNLADDEELNITIGGLNETNGYYVKVNNIDGVYIVKKELIDSFFKANKKLKGK